VLTARGRVHTGCNVENASYGLTMCAERVAVQKAVSEGDRRIVAVAVVGRRPVPPCGACRQVLAEFGAPAVILAGPRGPHEVFAFAQILPLAFALKGDGATRSGRRVPSRRRGGRKRRGDAP